MIMMRKLATVFAVGSMMLSVILAPPASADQDDSNFRRTWRDEHGIRCRLPDGTVGFIVSVNRHPGFRRRSCSKTAPPGPLKAEDWRFVAADDRVVIFQEVAATIRQGDMVEFSSYFVYRSQGIDNVKERVRANCKDRSFLILAVEKYSGRTLIEDTALPAPGELQHTDPKTILGRAITWACGGFKEDTLGPQGYPYGAAQNYLTAKK